DERHLRSPSPSWGGVRGGGRGGGIVPTPRQQMLMRKPVCPGARLAISDVTRSPKALWRIDDPGRSAQQGPVQRAQQSLKDEDRPLRSPSPLWGGARGGGPFEEIHP